MDMGKNGMAQVTRLFGAAILVLACEFIEELLLKLLVAHNTQSKQSNIPLWIGTVLMIHALHGCSAYYVSGYCGQVSPLGERQARWGFDVSSFVILSILCPPLFSERKFLSATPNVIQGGCLLNRLNERLETGQGQPQHVS